MTRAKRAEGLKRQNGEIQGFRPQDAGNISVNMFKDAGRIRLRVTVTGGATRGGMRAGLSAVIVPEEFASAKELKDGVGRTAAFLAKGLEAKERVRTGKYRPCIDEVDAYHGAVEMLDEVMLAARTRGLA